MSRRSAVLGLIVVAVVFAGFLSIIPIHATQQTPIVAVSVRNVAVSNLPATLLDPHIMASDSGRGIFSLQYSIRNDSSDEISIIHVFLRVTGPSGKVEGGEAWTEKTPVPAGSTKQFQTVLGHKIDPTDRVTVILQGVSSSAGTWKTVMTGSENASTLTAEVEPAISGGGGAAPDNACDPATWCAAGHANASMDCGGTTQILSFSCSVGATCSYSYTCRPSSPSTSTASAELITRSSNEVKMTVRNARTVE